MSSKIKEIYAKDVPAIAEAAQSWMENPNKDGAAWMMGYLYGHLTITGSGTREPDEVGLRISQAQARRCAASLSVADLYAVSAHKTLDVISAAGELPESMQVRREWFDTDNGFMVFEKGYSGTVWDNYSNRRESWNEAESRVLALSWRIFGNKLHLFGWTDTHAYLHSVVSRMDRRKEVTPEALKHRIAEIGPLIICGEHVCDLDTYMVRSKRVQAMQGRSSMSILLAACLMLRQDMTARSMVHVPMSMYRFGQKPDMNSHRAVTIIDKRQIKPNPTNEDIHKSENRRQLTVRYDVRGHWREYKSARFSPEVREQPVWIPYHWVGDESLPVVDRKKVTRLKR